MVCDCMNVSVNIEIPDDIANQLRPGLGKDLATAFKEALAVEAYRSEKLSIGQIAEMLGISIHEAEGLMKQRNVPASYSAEEFDSDRETLNRVLGT
jgi:predicted HTH domain antitoxin